MSGGGNVSAVSVGSGVLVFFAGEGSRNGSSGVQGSTARLANFAGKEWEYSDGEEGAACVGGVTASITRTG